MVKPLWIVLPCHRVIGLMDFAYSYAGGLWRKMVAGTRKS
jgi:O6-methylguanine-DNA--protein-cysteine methyltransferase